MAKATAYDVASFLVRFRTEHGDTITNLHLQKYLYYAQGWFLAFSGGEPLFDERLEAWVHGPAQPGVYGRFKHYRWNPITEAIDPPALGSDVETHLEEVLNAYGHFSAWDLERMSHVEAPWIEARAGLADDAPSSNVISHESMRRYFVGRLEKHGEAEKAD